ncbi:protein adenylyltransferase SelO [Diaphorobacter aerolatus]|uniref:protein adenylyltransferase SelO n=1 Tax=Diaphorobacter aerolatus TaxID=1288495 RepID=UPI00384D7655
MTLSSDGSSTQDSALQGPPWRASGFADLGARFLTELRPTPLPEPYWVGRNPQVAEMAGIDPRWLQTDEALQMLTGNLVETGMHPYATVYSGHQFGVWAGQLGDGRAITLGETQAGQEIQLKGSGRTPYSRMGDGRAVLRSSIREYLCSEAMHALGIPTTRALSVTGSAAPVYREQVETAAVVARVAPSFIRFGHFEHFSARGDEASLKAIADYVIDRYYPECRTSPGFAGNAYAALLHVVSERTAALIAQWQAVGFCHGVMNTDNMSILGLTIDYGPFQFLDAYVPGHICNHSDDRGRYAFDQQPNVGYWNLLCLAQALLPLIGEEEVAREAVGSYPEAFAREFKLRMAAKLGLAAEATEDARFAPLLQSLLGLMAQDAVDYTIFWRTLAHASTSEEYTPVRDLFLHREDFDQWLTRLHNVRLPKARDHDAVRSMLDVNPKFVLRNHLGEMAIRAAREQDFSLVHALQTVLATPFAEHPQHESFADFPPDWASQISISCSS